MADLHAGVGKAGEQLAAAHHTAADAGTQRDHHRRVAALGRARPVLAHSGAVGVVAQENGHVPLLMEELPERHISVIEGHIRVLHKQPRPVVHHAGQSYAHRLNLIKADAAYLAHLPRQPHQLGSELRGRHVLGHRAVHLVQDAPVFVYQAGHQIGAPYVNANIVHPFSAPSNCSAKSLSIRLVSSWAAL